MGGTRHIASSRITRLGRSLCLAGASFGAAGLIGWLVGMERLFTITPGRPPMLPNTGLALCLLGIAGALLHLKDPGRLRRVLVISAALVALLIALASIMEYVLGVQLPLAESLYGGQAVPYPARPSPPTAVALIMLAVAIIIFDWRPAKRTRPSEWLLLGAGLIAATGLLGYLYGAGPLYQLAGSPIVGDAIPMAAVRLLRASGGMLILGVPVPAAMSGLMISAGLLLERPDAGIMRVIMSRGPGGVLLRRLLPAAILTSVVLGFIAARFPGVQDVALVFAALTAVTTAASLLLLIATASRLNRVHEALEQTQARTRALIEQASDGIFIADPDGRFIDVNETGCRMAGYSREEMLTKYIPDLVPIHEMQRYLGATEHLVENGSHLAEWVARRKDGSLVPVEINVKVLPDGRWQGIVRDISKRKRAEEALRLSEAKYSGIVSISADAIISIDETQHVILFNEGAEKMFDRSSAEMIGAPLEILVPEHMRSGVKRNIESFRTGPETARQMSNRGKLAYGVRRNGEEFPVGAAISKLSIGGKSILTVTLRDITEQKRAEDEQRLLAEVGSVLATTLDFEDTLTNIARLVARDLADLCIMDVVESDQSMRRSRVVCRDPSKAWIEEALMRLPLDLETSWPIGSMKEIQHAVLIEPLTPSVLSSWALTDEHLGALQALDPKSAIAVPLLLHGNLLGSLLLVSSGRSRSFGQRDLRLVEAIAERAALSLENARLYRASKRASQVRDDVLGIVAHDLRNPLQIIATGAARLRMRGPETARQMGIEIGNAVQRMNRLIQDLLDVTKMEAGHLSIRPTRLRTAEVLTDSLEALQPLASSVSIDLRLSAATNLPDISADYDRLLQVFENLVGNAIKFTKPGGRVTLGAEARGSEVMFSVADTGPGIARSDLPHIFDRFWQASKITRRGAGLGLPIVKGIVEAHGGRVWVNSGIGEGSTFFFTIPGALQMATGPKRNYDKATLSPAQ